MTTKKLPRLVDKVVKPAYPGKKITLKSILDQEVVVTAFCYVPSQFAGHRDYLAIQVRRDTKDQWFITRSQFILDFFERVAQEILPCRVTFSLERKTTGGRTYTVR